MSDDFQARIASCGCPIKDSLGNQYRGLTLAETGRIARETGRSRKEIEIAALGAGVIPCRYYRNIPSLGCEGQAALLSSRVTVVGAGGLGGTVIEILARAGVGTLTVIDGESFSEDNLNRQVLCRESDLGRKKVEVAAERVKAINSSVEMIPRFAFITDDNAEALIGKSQVVVDALDRIPARIILEKAAERLKVPLVHGAIGGFLGEVAAVFPGERTLSAVYGAGGDASRRGIESVLGTPSPTPIAIGSLEAIEVIKILLRRGPLLRGRLLYLELENGIFSEIRLQHP